MGAGTTITSPSYSSYRRPSSGHWHSSAKLTRGSTALTPAILHRRYATTVPREFVRISENDVPNVAEITARVGGNVRTFFNPQILKSSDPQILRSSNPQILKSLELVRIGCL